MTLGDVDAWAEVFPEDLVPRIIDLVWTTWATFPKPSAKEHEVPITRRYRCALKVVNEGPPGAGDVLGPKPAGPGKKQRH